MEGGEGGRRKGICIPELALKLKPLQKKSKKSKKKANSDNDSREGKGVRGLIQKKHGKLKPKYFQFILKINVKTAKDRSRK